MINQIIESILNTREANQSTVEANYFTTIDIESKVEEIIRIMNDSCWSSILSTQMDKWKKNLSLAEELCKTIKKSIGVPDKRKGAIHEAHIRATRKYINLGAVGAWRQGKSTFLQGLISSNKWILPVANGKSCTATTINIINDSYMTKEEGLQTNVAVIYRYTINEMCELLNEYMGKMNVSYRINTGNRDEFVSFCNRYKNDTGYRPNEKNKGLKQTLIDYLENVEDYVDELLAIDPIVEVTHLDTDENKRELYRSYVAFTQTNGERKYKCLATKNADVYTAISIQGVVVNKIRIMDTPGIGEDRIKVNESLAKALSEDLDIIIAVTLLDKTTVALPVVKEFHSILAGELNGKNLLDMLYYVMNLVDELTDSNNKAAKSNFDQWKKDILTDLGTTTVEGIEGINLPENHIKAINCNSNREMIGFNKDGSLALSEERDAIPNYVLSVLQSTIQSIKRIDDGFYKRAFDEYSIISNAWEELKKAMGLISFPSYNIGSKIDGLCTELYNAFVEFGSKDYDITEKIKKDIQEFVGIDYGMVVKEILGIDSKEIISDDSIDSFVDGNYDTLKQKFPVMNFDNNREFVDYTERKKELIDLLRKKVLDCIHDEKANELLQSIKKRIFSILIEHGGMSFVCTDDTVAYEDKVNMIMQKLLESGCAPTIINRLNALIAFGTVKTDDIAQMNQQDLSACINKPLNTKKYLKECIDGKISDCSHKDDFGDFGFEEHRDAIKSYVYSLCELEENLKELLNSERFEKEIRIIRIDLNTTVKNILDIPTFKGVGEKTLTRVELENFYNHYSGEIFENDQDSQNKARINKIKKQFV